MRKHIFGVIIIMLVPLAAAFAAGWGFSGAGGFSVLVSKPDLGPINQELKVLGMPEFDQALFLYGGQGFGHIGERLRLGGMGFGGSINVEDFENSYARKASFQMGWGGVLLEYVIAEPGRFEFFGGGSVGWGDVNIHLEKSAAPQNWDDLWGNYQAVPDSATNTSSDLNHSFFLIQPRLGMRFYIIDWMAISGSVEIPITNLSSGGWSVNGQDIYNAPSLNLISPIFHFAILFGG